MTNAEASKRAAILEAEGVQQSQVSRAQGEMEAAVLRAKGMAEARLAMAEAAFALCTGDPATLTGKVTYARPLLEELGLQVPTLTRS